MKIRGVEAPLLNSLLGLGWIFAARDNRSDDRSQLVAFDVLTGSESRYNRREVVRAEAGPLTGGPDPTRRAALCASTGIRRDGRTDGLALVWSRVRRWVL